MDTGSGVNVQSIRERFEIRRPPVEDHQFDLSVGSDGSCRSDDGSSSPSLPGFNANNGSGSSSSSSSSNRISIKRSPAFRTGIKLDNQPQTAVILVDGGKKPNLKRKPGVDRSSKPMGLNSPDSLLEEALRAPLPSGPAPKKPPRTFQHDAFLLRDEVDGNVKKNPLMSRSKTEPFLQRGPQKGVVSGVPVQWNNSFPPTPLERAPMGMNRDGTAHKMAAVRHVYDSPSAEGDLHYMCSPVVMMEDRRWTGHDIQRPPTDESSDADESDNDIRKRKLVEDRKIYVRRVSSKVCDSRRAVNRPLSLSNVAVTNQATSCSPSSSSSSALSHPPGVEPGAGLFETFLVVALFYDRQLHKHTPYIKSSYPNNAIVPPGMEHFCFPDSSHWPPPPRQSASAPYTIVLTDSKGDRMFGYCRRIVPEGAQGPIPITYCLLSRHRAAGFYTKLLNAMVARHGSAESQRTSMLDHLHSQSFPRPGRSVELLPHLNNSEMDPPSAKIQRLLDGRLEDVDLRVLFEQLNETVVLHVLGTVLLERKLIFVSQNLSVLSLCIDAVQSMLYPFVWQHTLVPVLPSSMTEIASAPTPFILGILSQNVDDWNSIQPDQGMLVDLDSGKVLHSVGDESTILPKRSVRKLTAGWEETVALTQQAETARNALYSESFLRTFVDLCGHYAQHIHISTESGAKYFERAVFAKSHSNAGVRDFLEWFTETAMFSLFIESRLRIDAGPTLFDHKILEHSMQLLGGGRNNNGASSSSVGGHQLIMPNSRILGRKIKNIGDKLREMNVFS